MFTKAQVQKIRKLYEKKGIEVTEAEAISEFADLLNLLKITMNYDEYGENKKEFHNGPQ